MVVAPKKKALVLINRGARLGAEKKDLIVSCLIQIGLELKLLDSAKPSMYSAIIQQTDADMVIIGGGDGSVNAALDGLVTKGLPLGFIPLGTANNLARNLGIPLETEQAIKVINEQNLQNIDVGVVNSKKFLNVAGFGISTKINNSIPHQLKKRWGSLAYGLHGFRLVKNSRPFTVNLVQDGEIITTKTLQVTVCNGKFYGMGLMIDNEATIDDGLLNIMIPKIDVWWKGLKFIPGLLTGKHNRILDATIKINANQFEIKTKLPREIDTDGEITTKTPATFSVLAKALKVFVPIST